MNQEYFTSNVFKTVDSSYKYKYFGAQAYNLVYQVQLSKVT